MQGRDLTRRYCIGLVIALTTMALGGRFFLGETASIDSTNRQASTTSAVTVSEFCSSGPITIPAGSFNQQSAPYPSTIQVAGLTGVISNVSVRLNNLQHNWGRDIDLLLVGPNGEKFVIMSDVGQSQGFDAPATITISDSAPARFTNLEGPIPTGSYKPTNYNDACVSCVDAFPAPAPQGPYAEPGPVPSGSATFMSVFNQANPNGTWSLYVVDDSTNNVGTMESWCLIIETAAAAPNNLQFAATNFNGNAAGVVTATVNRINGSSAVSVSYLTSDGSATGGSSCSAGVDYISTSGTLNFAEGESSKPFTVALCPDSTLEPNETIRLTLSNPTGGAFIGTPGTATITIIPNGPQATQFCNANAIQIPISGITPIKATPYPSIVNVAGMNGVVNSVKLTINDLYHSWGSDVDVLLVSPDGRAYVPLSDIGGQSGFIGATTITLTDAATSDLFNVAIPIPDGTYIPGNLDLLDDAFPSPAPGGPYGQSAPIGRATFANVFNNSNPNGDWKLYIVDDSPAAGGSIAGWCVDIVAGPALPNTIQFDRSNFNRASNRTADVTVVRPNTSAGPVSVDFATSNGTAIGGPTCEQSGVDYISVSGRLGFADGEPSKNVPITLCGGDAAEPVETINLTLSNPGGGAVIGSPGNATVSIYNGALPCDVTFRRADSPHIISTQRVIFDNQVACVEPGTRLQFQNGGKLLVYGELRAVGTPTDRITFTGGQVIDSAGPIELGYADVGVYFNISDSFIARDTNFQARSGITSFFGISRDGNIRFVDLENVVFDSNEAVQSANAQLYGNFLYLLMKDVTFRNRAFFNATVGTAKFVNLRSENGAYEGLSFGSTSLQPLLLENLNVSNCARGGLDLFSGDFFLGGNVAVQNCEYPITGRGGIVPGSVAPTTGNRNNWIEMSDQGSGSVYANVGLPYVIHGFVNIGGIEWEPGVVIKARPGFAFNTGGGSPLNFQGLPGAPVTLEPFDPAQKWFSGQFNSTGDRVEYAIIDGVERGIGSPEATGAPYYIDSSIIRNNTVGIRDMLNSNAPGFFQSNLFTNNQTAIVAEGARIKGHYRSNPNLFENNIVAVSSISVPDLRNAWWNSPTGPTTDANPGGTGDRINGTARFRPFLTTRPDTTDHPPVVRMPRVPYVGLYGAYQGLAEAGQKITIKWDASDDRQIVKQKILFSPNGNSKLSFTKIADNLPPDQRSFELTVPSVGFVQGDSVQFVRVVAVDDKGQEGWEDWQFLIPSGEITGDLTITADVAGRTFHPGDQIPFTYQINQGFPFGAGERFIIFDADRTVRSFGANTIATMPPVSTDTARLMVVYVNSLNQQKFFFSQPFSIRYDSRFPDAPPQVAVTSPSAGQQFNAGDVVPIQWTGSDDEGIRYYNIQVSTDRGRTWTQIAEKLAANTTTYAWQPRIRDSIADVRVRVIAVDRRFQNTSDTRTVSFAGPPNLAPTVQVTYPANGATYTVGQSTFIAANASDPDGTIQRVEFYAKGSAFQPQGDPHFIGSDTTAPYQVPWIYPDAESFVVTARAYDNRNRLVTSQPINVTVNPFTPAPLPIPAPELTSPVDGAVYPAPATITLEALPAPTTRTYVRVEFYNGTTLVGTDTSSPYSFTLNNLPAGKYTFFVKSVADNNAESISAVTDVTVGNVATTHTRFDFDGDGRADVSVFRPSDSVWHLLNSTGGYSSHQFGNSTDVLVPADYDGDGKFDIAVYRGGTWYLLQSTAGTRIASFGLSSDIPQPGDYDGDGKADLAVFRPSEGLWYLQQSSAGFAVIPFGSANDRAEAGDYDGDGKTDAAIFRPESGQWWIRRSSNGSVLALQFGIGTDVAVPSDYTGDGKTDIALWRPTTGEWFVLRSEDFSYYAAVFGQNGDVPAPADYDGDGRSDLGIFRQGNWYLLKSTGGIDILQFGVAGDIPIPK